MATEYILSESELLSKSKEVLQRTTGELIYAKEKLPWSNAKEALEQVRGVLKEIDRYEKKCSDLIPVWALINDGSYKEAEILLEEVKKETDPSFGPLIEAETIIKNRIWEEEMQGEQR